MQQQSGSLGWGLLSQHIRVYLAMEFSSSDVGSKQENEEYYSPPGLKHYA
jgi:hypothetical protein